ncbi:MAG: phage tail protein [Akkermansia sp.]|nr:phage tail protein [Akkermansia sp.]
MILATADGLTVYDSRLGDRALLGLKVTTAVNKAGTAEITMAPEHPAYDSFTMYRSIVEISRDNELLFRGRPLYPTYDNDNCKKITCEGERCFLRDAAMRPYLYQDTPAAIFADLVNIYNSQVEAAKSFQVGTVTVTDENDYVRLESEKAGQVADAMDKLVERCGGYIVFTTNDAGQRVINWYESLGYQSSQVIEFGVNLLDYTRSQASTDLATRIIPYGAKSEETGEYVTIESVNDGLDFIEDADAVALRGVIARPVYWDDVTQPANLLRKAQQYLATSKMIITSLELSAVDLSILDKDIDSLRVGDTIQVRSRPHNVDDRFLLQQRTYDLLDPAQDKVVLGKDLATLTGADVAGDRDAMSELHRTEHIIRADYQLGIANAVKTTQETLFSLIQQTSDAIRLEVSETYATNGEVDSKISTTMTQLADSFNFEFETLRAVVDENDAEARAQFETIRNYIRFVDGNIILGEEGNELTLRIENDRISFLDGGAEVAYFSNQMLYVLDGHFLHSLQVGKFAFLPRENGNLSLVKVGD